MIKEEFTINDYIKLKEKEADEAVARARAEAEKANAEAEKANAKAEKFRAEAKAKADDMILVIRKMHTKGMPVGEIAELVQMTESEIKRIVTNK